MPQSPIRIQELPYLSHVPTDGRKIPVFSFLDETGTWHAYISQAKGMLIEFRPIEAMSASYLCKGIPPTSRDSYLPLCHLVTQHFSFADTMGILRHIEEDYLNGLASVHKYFLLLDHAKASRDLVPHVALTTEIEFAFSNHRAFYDLLTGLLMTMYKRFIMADKNGHHIRPANLPDSFSRLLQKSDSDLASKYHLPKPLIDFHRGKASVFGRLCKMRDNIVHHGHTPDFVFNLPDGFALGLSDRMWDDLQAMDIWPAKLLKPNRLASVLGLLVFLVEDMEDAMSGLAKALAESVRIPQAIAEGYKVYLRNHLLVHRAHLAQYKEKHWFDPTPILERCKSEWSRSS
jgi:hypothetical protein